MGSPVPAQRQADPEGRGSGKPLLAPPTYPTLSRSLGNAPPTDKRLTGRLEARPHNGRKAEPDVNAGC